MYMHTLTESNPQGARVWGCNHMHNTSLSALADAGSLSHGTGRTKRTRIQQEWTFGQIYTSLVKVPAKCPGKWTANSNPISLNSSIKCKPAHSSQSPFATQVQSMQHSLSKRFYHNVVEPLSHIYNTIADNRKKDGVQSENFQSVFSQTSNHVAYRPKIG